MKEAGEIKIYKHLFGPVASRRLGRSLGVDLIPYKTCTFDCIYCQLGRTTNKTIERKEYVPIDNVMAEIEHKLKESPQPDYITFSGSGEPTLHAGIGEIIKKIKSITSIPVAVLTNGSLLHREDVRSDLMQADLIVPSLDAGDPFMFGYINRPHEKIEFHRMVQGMAEFCREFKGQVWMEVFLLSGINAFESEIDKIVELLKLIKPKKVQLNTAVRPTAESYAHAVDHKKMEELAKLFDPPAEVVSGIMVEPAKAKKSASEEDIISFLRRRPATLEDISIGTAINPAELTKLIAHLAEKKKIKTEYKEGSVFYVLAK